MILQQLSSLQIELLKTFALNPSEDDLIFIRKVLAAYFSNKSKILSSNDLEEWLGKSSIQIITPTDVIHLPFVQEPLTEVHKNLMTTQSKNALADAIAKEEPLILE